MEKVASKILAISILSLNLLFGDITGIVFRDLPFNGSS